MNEKLNGQANANNTNESLRTTNTTTNGNNTLPDRLKSILDNVDTESISLLSLTEMLKLKTHLNQRSGDQKSKSSSSRNLNKNLVDAAYEHEKNGLINEAHQLRDLLAKLSQSEQLVGDWRGDLIKAVANIFQNENENCLAELHAYVLNHAYADQDKQLAHIESKMENQAKFHADSLAYLSSVDRESLLGELKASAEQIAKLSEEIDVLRQNERQSKREFKLMEYAKDAEVIKGNDLKQSLNTEKTKCLEFMDKLNQEKKKTNAMQEQLCDLNEEFVKIKDNLRVETENFNLVW